MQPPERPYMVLCDLEGTLLDIPNESSRHRAALSAAVTAVTGLRVQLPAVRDQHTDFTLVFEALDGIGLADTLTEETFELIAQLAAERYARECPLDLGDCLRPGVAATLDALFIRPDIKVVPCTGMVYGIARELIERAGLGRPLAVAFGAYAAFGRTRPDLIDAARGRAGGYAGLAWPPERTVVVSRCAGDLTAARSAGVLTVGIGEQFAHGDVADVHVELFEQLPQALRSL